MKNIKRVLCTLLAVMMIFSFFPTPVRASEEITGTRRALLIGNQDYLPAEIPDLKGPIGDTEKVELMLLEQRHPYRIDRRINLTKAEMRQAIRTAYAGAREEDLNVFYYAGHGAYDRNRDTSYLTASDGENLYAEELAELFRDIPGRFLVLLDACNSGGIIDNPSEESPLGNAPILWSPIPEEEGFLPYATEERFEPTVEETTEAFLSSFMEPFSSQDRGLSGSKYKVIASSHKEELSWEFNYRTGWGWGGIFTRGLATGNGYRGVFLADLNRDQRVSFDELVSFLKSGRSTRGVVNYPAFSSFEVGTAKTAPDPKAQVRHDVPVYKTWTVEFNQEIRTDSAETKIRVNDWSGKPIRIEVVPSDSKSVLRLRPLELYDENSYFKLTIEKGLTGKNNGAELKKPVVLHFFTGNARREEEARALVLGGRLPDYPNKTVEEAFAKKIERNGTLVPLFRNAKWIYRLDERNREHFIEFTGALQMNQKNVTLTATFTVDLIASAFALTFIGIGNVPLTEQERSSLFRTLYE